MGGSQDHTARPGSDAEVDNLHHSGGGPLRQQHILCFDVTMHHTLAVHVVDATLAQGENLSDIIRVMPSV